MKKVLLALTATLLLISGGYYFLFVEHVDLQENLKVTQAAAETSTDDKNIEPIMTLEEPLKKVIDYYVVSSKANVYSQADKQSLIVRALYKGEKVSVLESKGEWLRLSDFIVLREGEKPTSEWIEANALSDVPLHLNQQEKLSILDGYLKKSDNFSDYKDLFRDKTQQLLDNGTCVPEDFEELGGWVRSITYKKYNVYFIYCGGLSQSNKLYLNVDTKEIFRR
ncbi:SH3 domain-containing protein [Vibrio sagamiensis]|uniref:SH3b domain-containing protein n=1 Tax=Vibrio sagamiensis NBRC 104589 TaxID=1219064 RepID=A0A511QGC7_9VIBR|nr:SH3 domain-containing protein [Vibrio sagamiensis]PNQ53977.1 SH3 domain-containing protein [Vibrio agarivorans]GEM76206.1 hypothetical protein VSA01S_23180 [Vibrio sagamiensis NBRC 104589]